MAACSVPVYAQTTGEKPQPVQPSETPTPTPTPVPTVAPPKAPAPKPPVSGYRAPVRGANTGDFWYRLRLCESGNDYSKNTGNGYYGAYQYDLSTWSNYGGYSRPDLAPPGVQDQKAQSQYAYRYSKWPQCSHKAEA